MIGHMSAVSREAQRFPRRGEGAPQVHGRHLPALACHPGAAPMSGGGAGPGSPELTITVPSTAQTQTGTQI